MATIKTIKARQRKVITLPNFSKREFLEGETNFFDAFASIVKAFEKYSFGDKLIVYQREWRDFPFNEFQLACNLLCSK